MTVDNFIKLPWLLEREPPPFEGNDIKFPEGLARHILKRHTKKGDKVFDPFAGLGTSMFVAEEMGRLPFGFETEEKKFQWVAGQMENWTHLIHDDTANITKYDLPKMDLILTSPPYMPRHHKYNPLFGGDPKHAGYEKYLKRMAHIFGKLTPIMKKSTPLIIQVDNLQHGKIFTPLVRDIANCLEKNFIQMDETKILWQNPKADYPYTQYLTFKKKT
jgi:hypothetical protein